MVKRRVRKSKKTARTTKKKRPRSAKRSKMSAKELASNRKALWGTYQDMQKQVNKAWAKIRTDIKKKASPEVILRDRNNLLLMLGECNYMARECMRHVRKANKSRR